MQTGAIVFDSSKGEEKRGEKVSVLTPDPIQTSRRNKYDTQNTEWKALWAKQSDLKLHAKPSCRIPNIVMLGTSSLFCS